MLLLAYFRILEYLRINAHRRIYMCVYTCMCIYMQSVVDVTRENNYPISVNCLLVIQMKQIVIGFT